MTSARIARSTSRRSKRPKEIEFRDSLPKTLVGKTLRRQLAQEEKAKRKSAVPA